MAYTAIEVQLHQVVNRKKLRQEFGRLAQDDAAALLGRLLSADGSRLSEDFRRLHRAVRLQMLLILVGRLGSATRKSFHKRLTSRGPDADLSLQKGLRWVFPAGREACRDKFLRALAAGTRTGIPSATLKFRGDGIVALDNQSKVVMARRSPLVLGVSLNAGVAQNFMEICATVTGHRDEAAYDFRRRVEVGHFWCVQTVKMKATDSGEAWEGKYKPWHDDNLKGDTDEDLSPDNDHIYVVDGPGPDMDPALTLRLLTEKYNSVSQYVFAMNAIETAHVWTPEHGWLPMGLPVHWCTVTWLKRDITTDKETKVERFKVWERRPKASLIREGEIKGLEAKTRTRVEPSFDS